jgi:hypothetical protein
MATRQPLLAFVLFLLLAAGIHAASLPPSSVDTEGAVASSAAASNRGIETPLDLKGVEPASVARDLRADDAEAGWAWRPQPSNVKPSTRESKPYSLHTKPEP